MKKQSDKVKISRKAQELNPEKPAERRQIIEEAVRRTVEEYGEALKRLGTE